MTTYIVRLTGEDVETIREALDYYEEHNDPPTDIVALEVDEALESVSRALAARVPLEPAMDDVQEEDGTV